jgi:hypothetical protein
VTLTGITVLTGGGNQGENASNPAFAYHCQILIYLLDLDFKVTSMKLKLVICSHLLLLFVAFAAFGQASKTPMGISPQVKKEEVIALKSRLLIVASVGVPQIDKDIEELVKKLWKFNSEIQFCDNKTIDTKLAASESGYAILSFDQINFVLGGDLPDGANRWMRASLKLSEKYNKTKPAYFQDIIASVEGKELKLRKREIIFALQSIQNHLLARSEDKKRINNYAFEALENAGTLEKKILLIDEKFIGKKYTVEELKKDYPFQFKISNYAAIEKAQLEKNKQYAFLELAPMGSDVNLLVHLIVNCDDGEIISYGEFYNGFGDRYSNFVSKDHVIAYTKYSDYYKYKEQQKKKSSDKP